jgi:hypothetical protein
MTGLEAPEGRDIGKSTPQYFKPQRGAILIFCYKKNGYCAHLGLKKGFLLFITDILHLWRDFNLSSIFIKLMRKNFICHAQPSYKMLKINV